MHIAHPDTGFWTVSEIAARTGLKRRQIANLAKMGLIPDARRGSDGLHFVYPKTADSLAWIQWKGKKVAATRVRRFKTTEPNRRGGLLTLPGMRQWFDVWLGRVERDQPLEQWPTERIGDVLLEIAPMVTLTRRLNDLLKDRTAAQ